MLSKKEKEDLATFIRIVTTARKRGDGSFGAEIREIMRDAIFPIKKLEVSEIICDTGKVVMCDKEKNWYECTIPDIEELTIRNKKKKR